MNNSELGLIGLGTMGRNLLLNMADHGFAVAGYDKDPGQVGFLEQEAQDVDIFATADLSEFMGALQSPKRVLLLVPAGKIVDAVINDLKPHLSEGDIIIDGGNSHFPDTNRRQKELLEEGIHFIGLGISGGSEGARRGPSMMPGGNSEAYLRVAALLEAVSAKVDGDPCVTYLGKGAVGHYTKMVHNGIEYGLMQLLAEAYDLMKRGLELSNTMIGKEFSSWNEAELEGFLVEITAQIFDQKAEDVEADLIDVILDQSRSKGTGKWTSQDAMNLGAPVPVIDMAVIMRYLSAYKEERLAAQERFPEPGFQLSVDAAAFLPKLRNAIYFSFIITYAQGMQQLHEASKDYDYQLDLEAVARIWRGGCIIRAALLELFRKAYQTQPDLPNLIMDPAISQLLQERQQETREVVIAATAAGVPIAAISNALLYFDAYRSGRLPANLIQAQRDFFGSHTYQRIDKPGKFHTDWGK